MVSENVVFDGLFDHEADSADRKASDFKRAAELKVLGASVAATWYGPDFIINEVDVGFINDIFAYFHVEVLKQKIFRHLVKHRVYLWLLQFRIHAQPLLLILMVNQVLVLKVSVSGGEGHESEPEIGSLVAAPSVGHTALRFLYRAKHGLPHACFYLQQKSFFYSVLDRSLQRRHLVRCQTLKNP